MRKSYAVLFTMLLGSSMFFAASQQVNAVSYTGHDGSLDENLTKIKVEPYKGKKDLWTYIVQACADKHTIAVSQIILKSDIATVNLGVNKNIPKGECSIFGAVMKAKDGQSLGAEIIEKHEALERMQNIVNDIPTMSKKEIQSSYKELIRLVATTGFMVR